MYVMSIYAENGCMKTVSAILELMMMEMLELERALDFTTLSLCVCVCIHVCNDKETLV